MKPFEAYNGNEPFMFVSYAHANKKDVYPDIEYLHKMGYRIWYDEGIEAGEEFRKKIGDKIRKCSFLIVFLSPEAVESSWVPNETLMALKREKQVLPIFLQQTEIPPDLELELSPKKQLFTYEISRQEYLEELEKALPSSLKNKPAINSKEEEFSWEIAFRIKKHHSWNKDLYNDLVETGELLGIGVKEAKKIIDKTLADCGIDDKYAANIEKLRLLIVKLLNSGEIQAERRQIISNRAADFGIRAEHWESIVQEESIKKAQEQFDLGDFETAKRFLVFSVGKHMPQSKDVLSLLEQIEMKQQVSHLPPEVTHQNITVQPTYEAAQSPSHDRATTLIGDDISIRWVRVPAGLFVRGCPEDFIQNIKRKYKGLNVDVLDSFPLRKEPIEEFWISKTSVTNAQFHTFVKETSHRFPAGWHRTSPPYERDAADKPVTGITWQDSQDFSEWLGARLPTRAEYEKACRGENGMLYPWGNNFDATKCNTDEAGLGHATSVDTYPSGASVYDILDLVGNVWEWVADSSDNLKMTVGASFESTGEFYGVGFFDVSRPPESSENNLGFRVACDNVRKLFVKHLDFNNSHKTK